MVDRRLVIGIDMGYANLGVCILDTADLTIPTYWANERIWFGRGKPTENELFWAMHAWCQRHIHLLYDADLIVLERQMQARFKIMNTVIRTLHPRKTRVVSPNSVTSHFKFTNKREIKKAQAVTKCRELFPAFEWPGGKLDDMADAALLAKYALDTFYSAI